VEGDVDESILNLLIQIVVHPATMGVAVLLVAATMGMVTRSQLTRSGLTALDGEPIRWSVLLAALVFWMVVALGGSLVAQKAGLPGTADALLSLFGLTLSVLPALLILAAAGWYHGAHRRSTDPAIQTELRWVRWGAGGLAGVALVQAPLFPIVLVVGVGAGMVWLVNQPDAKGRLSGWTRDVHAGAQLRNRLPQDATVQVDGEEVTVIGTAGLLTTDVLGSEGALTLPNHRVLAAVSSRGIGG